MALASHYYRPDFTPTQAQTLIADMVDDLEEFTIGEIEVAVRTYRRDPGQRFFPRSAELRGLVLGERKDRMKIGPVRCAVGEFGDQRPILWEYTPKRFWAKHWQAEDLRKASDPQRYDRFCAWRGRRGEKCNG